MPLPPLLSQHGGSAGERDQIDKNFFFKITDILNQMIKSTYILYINLFLKKNKIWSLFPALTPHIIRTEIKINKSNFKTYCKACIEELGEEEGGKTWFPNKRDRI